MRIAITSKSALVIVDVQKDFLPGGALPVPDGDLIIEPLNRYINLFKTRNRPIIATRDWHPKDHISFRSRGGPWPPHCVQNTRGAEFADDLKLPEDVIIIDKAFMKDRDAYSGFQETILDLELRRRGIKRIFVGGLATEYCVRATVLDGLTLGYEVILLLDAIKGINLQPGDSEKAIREMLESGAIGITIEDIVK